MKENDLNKVAMIEKSIEKKYGKDAVKNPKSGWTNEKEARFTEQSKKFYRNLLLVREKRKQATRQSQTPCSVCGKDYFFMNLQDEVVYHKHGVCFDCYVDHIQGRPGEE